MQEKTRKAGKDSRALEKPATNWMRIDIAPLIAQQIYARKPLPGTGGASRN